MNRMISPWVIWNSYKALISAPPSVTNAGQSTLERSPFGSSAAVNPLKREEKSTPAVAVFPVTFAVGDEQALPTAATVAEPNPHTTNCLRLSTSSSYLEADVDAGQRLADRASHLRRLGRGFEPGGVEPIDVA